MSVRRRQVAERIERHIALNLLPGRPNHEDAKRIKEGNSLMGRYLRWRAKRQQARDNDERN